MNILKLSAGADFLLWENDPMFLWQSQKRSLNSKSENYDPGNYSLEMTFTIDYKHIEY